MTKTALSLIFVIGGGLILGACDGERAAPPAPVLELGTRLDSTAGAIIVEDGETVYGISQRYNLPMQDIIALNNIAPPYRLHRGQRLKLPAPRHYNIQRGDTLYGVSRMFGVSVTDLARTNRLSAPYTLNVGQRLRIPSRNRAKPKEMASSSQPAPPQARPAKTPQRSVPSKPVHQETVTSKPFSRPSMTAGEGNGRFVAPVSGRVISAYGPKDGGLHNDGINIAAARGTAVRAAGSGTVIYQGSDLGSFGNLVILRHSNGWVTAYAHMDDIIVNRGQAIGQGDIVGHVGSTGRVDSPQLHFEIRRGAEAMNPQKYLSDL